MYSNIQLYLAWRNGTNPDIRFVVDERHKILYCELPKVGCTNWKRTMLQLIHPETFGRLPFDQIKGPHGHYGEKGYKYISDWPISDRFKMVKEYYKFVFVRHPLERLLSAYRDKVQYDFLRHLPFPIHHIKGHDTDGLPIHHIKEHDADAFMDIDIEGFHAFLKYLVKDETILARGSRSRHWKRFVDLCGICSFDWNFVGKLETVNRIGYNMYTAYIPTSRNSNIFQYLLDWSRNLKIYMKMLLAYSGTVNLYSKMRMLMG